MRINSVRKGQDNFWGWAITEKFRTGSTRNRVTEAEKFDITDWKKYAQINELKPREEY